MRRSYPPFQPAADQGLDFALAPAQRDYSVEIKTVIFVYLQPPGEEVSGESQFITFGSAGLYALYSHVFHFRLLTIIMVAATRR